MINRLNYFYLFKMLMYIMEIINHYDNSIKYFFLNYKLTVELLYSNADFFLDLKNVQIDYSRKQIEIEYLETIWYVEHYEYIEKIKTFDVFIKKILKIAFDNNLIYLYHYEFMIKMIEKINLIFEHDKALENLYGLTTNLDIKQILNKQQIQFFFDILNFIMIFCKF